jgi:hypothetical protein
VLHRSLLGLLLALPFSSTCLWSEPQISRILDICPVWSGHPVGFALLTQNARQFVAFYDAERRMTVAARNLDSDRWTTVHLPSSLVWDSHNYIALVADDEGYLHLSGNMHAIPLVYFRTTRPWDINSFEKVEHMVGTDEARCTYPMFFRDPDNDLIFTYRDGVSGNGNQIYNKYYVKSKTWQRLLDKPLTSNEGHVSAYLQGPLRGPDGWFHLIWVWRNTGDCATNHDLSYARSRDLVHWETSFGKPLALPMTTKTAEVIDPVPVHGGIINGSAHLGWDSKKRTVITYHKFDDKGLTQAYAARLEDGHWKFYLLSDWTYRWDFQGGGSIPFEITLGALHPTAPGELQMDYRHIKHGSGTWRIDEQTMKVIGQAKRERLLPASLDKVESDFPGMSVKMQTSPGKDVTYVLRWETLGPNRDRPREGPLPGPSMLRLYEIKR